MSTYNLTTDEIGEIDSARVENIDFNLPNGMSTDFSMAEQPKTWQASKLNLIPVAVMFQLWKFSATGVIPSGNNESFSCSESSFSQKREMNCRCLAPGLNRSVSFNSLPETRSKLTVKL